VCIFLILAKKMGLPTISNIVCLSALIVFREVAFPKLLLPCLCGGSVQLVNSERLRLICSFVYWRSSYMKNDILFPWKPFAFSPWPVAGFQTCPIVLILLCSTALIQLEISSSYYSDIRRKRNNKKVFFNISGSGGNGRLSKSSSDFSSIFNLLLAATLVANSFVSLLQLLLWCHQ